MSTLSLLAVVAVATVSGFALLFLLARRLENFGLVDVLWSLGFAPVAVFYAWAGGGDGTRRATIAAMVAVWSLRLGGHLARRVLGQHPAEDERYRRLRRDWGARLDLKMFLFFQAQAASLVALSLPFLAAARNPAPAWHPLEVAGLLLWLVATAGEALADAQLARFKRDPANTGRVCTAGLWRWSRHPNYFFEWLVWVAFALFAGASPGGWVGVPAAALMLFLLLKVTGIRYTEEQLLRSKGDAYRDYQQRTSAFVPWPQRQPPLP